MDRQIIDISGDGVTLRKSRGSMQVVQKDEDGETHKTLVPFDEIEALMLHGRYGNYSHELLLTLAEKGIPVILCNQNHMPVSWLWPMEGHFEQSRRMSAQLNVKEPAKKRFWASLVREKINNQGRVLDVLGRKAGAFAMMAKKVRSGDPDNMEAQAASRYWPMLFGAGFLRDAQNPGLNAWLNYGYAIIRARTARAVVAAGLHPSLGLFHRNRYNAFCLVDDVMEPFRPVVDHQVFKMMQAFGGNHDQFSLPMDWEAKKHLVAILDLPVEMDNGVFDVGAAIDLLAQSLGMAYLEERKKLVFPVAYPSFDRRLL